jgi:hypothetical protein
MAWTHGHLRWVCPLLAILGVLSVVSLALGAVLS